MSVYRTACLLLLVLTTPLRAEVPSVVTDIAPVQALVADVMDGVGAPAVLQRPGVSPHGFALRPSQAQELQNADLVIWIGPELTPWLEKPLATLAGATPQLALLDSPATLRLAFRGEERADAQGEADHAEAGDAPDGHGHSGIDPHAWLDPRNAAIWVGLIAQRLSALDPDNAELYRGNAKATAARLAGLEADLHRQLAGRLSYVAYHDAFHYFETRFGLTLVGTIAPGDATGPGPAHIARLRQSMAATGVTCVFGEPQLSPRLLKTATEGMDITIRTLDPLGSGLTPGPRFYDRLLRGMADSFAACAKD